VANPGRRLTPPTTGTGHVTHRILLLSGPNLNLLGTRQPEIYSTSTLDDVVAAVTQAAAARDATVTHLQSNHEGELVEALHAAIGAADGLLINLAAYSHTSVALRDAIAATELPCVEVHLSNVHAREGFRHTTLTGGVSLGVITGFGVGSYTLGLTALLDHLDA
jgi:3-dehydroquinate dehydratase-2